MRRLISIVVCAWCFDPCPAQVLNATGVTMTVSAGTEMVVEGGARLNASAIFRNDGTVRVLGDWTNNSGGVGFSALGGGTVRLHNPLPQSIQGTAVTDFRSLILSGGSKTLVQDAICGTPAQTDGLLTLTSGVLLLNGRTFTLFNPASSALVYTGGSIRSESTDLLSRFQWALGIDITEHRIPFTDATDNVLPFAFIPAAALPTNTLLSVATYPTAPDNTLYPVTVNQQVLHVAGVSVADNSANTVDRFWLVDLPNGSFTGSLHLSYSPLDDPFLGPGPVRAQRWLEAAGTWQVPLPGQTQPFLREVVVPSVVFADAITPTNEHIWAMAYDNTPLPVTLISFDAWCEGNTMLVAWSTASEQRSADFTVERSIDGIEWVVVGSMQAAGNSSQLLDYSIEDGTAIAGNDLLYRLWQEDTDGTKTLLSTISSTPCAAGELVLFPNPATNIVYALLPGNVDPNASVSVRDARGSLIFHQHMTSGGWLLTLNVQEYATGTYHISIAGTDHAPPTTGRFVKE